MIPEAISAVAIVAVAILFLNPTHLTMPDSAETMLILGILVAFFIFAAFILREKPRDERESVHILTAGRISYLIGVSTLIIGTISQALSHDIDKWLIFALCTMVLSKLLSRIYLNLKM